MTQLERVIQEPFLIYGAGAVARMVFPYLLNGEFKCKGIALTNVEDFKSDNKERFKVPVRSVSDWALSDIKKDILIIIATSEQFHQEIKNICNSFGFCNLVPLTSELNDDITLMTFKQFFERKHIDYSQDILQIGSMRMVNLLKRSDIPNGVNMLGQLGDFVFPDTFGDTSFIAEGPYEHGPVYLKRGDVVIDCGSNFGVFSVYAASKGCECYAFEPTPVLNDLIKEQSALNENQIHPVLMAVSDRAGEALFHIDKYSSGGSSLFKRTKDTDDINVTVVSLDQFVKDRKIKKIDFIKADIEGAERYMLRGAKEVLKQFAPKLSICTYHLKDDPKVLESIILEANPNYTIVHKWEKLFAWVE